METQIISMIDPNTHILSEYDIISINRCGRKKHVLTIFQIKLMSTYIFENSIPVGQNV